MTVQSSKHSGFRGVVERYSLAAFGVLVVLFSVLVGLANLGRETAPFAYIFVPAIAALVVAGVGQGLPGIRLLFARLTRWRVAPSWYVAALAIPLAVWLGIVLVGVLLGAPVSGLFQNLDQLPVVMLVVLIPAFIEEFGWRGFAVPAAPRSWPLILTALVVGVLFLIPHVALYLPGNYYENLPMWPLFLIVISFSVVFTWGFVGSGGSVIIAAVMHAMSNGLTPLSRGIDPIVVWQLQGILTAVVAIAVVILSRRMRQPTGELETRQQTDPAHNLLNVEGARA